MLDKLRTERWAFYDLTHLLNVKSISEKLSRTVSPGSCVEWVDKGQSVSDKLYLGTVLVCWYTAETMQYMYFP